MAHTNTTANNDYQSSCRILQNYAIYGLPQHNSERWLSKFLQDLHNNNNDLSDHKQLQTTPLGHRYQIIYQTQQQNTLDFIDLGVLVEIQ
jgi:hypothetical protein